MAQVVLPPQQDALGQLHQLMTLKEAMDTRKLREFQLSEAQRKATENINFDKAVMGGGSEEDITGKMQAAGAEPYMKWMTHLAGVHEADHRRQIERNNEVESSANLLADRLGKIADIEDPEDQKKVYANVRQSAINQKIPFTEMLLPEKLDAADIPAHLDQLLGVSKLMKVSSDALDIKHKKAAETRAQAEEQRKIDAEQRTIETHKLAMQGDTETQHFNNIYLPGALEEKGIHPPMVPTKTDVEQAYSDFKKLGSSSKDTDAAHYAELFKLKEQGTATPDQLLELKGLERRMTLAGTNTFQMNNPAGQTNEIGYLADVAEQRGIESMKEMAGGNKVKIDQVSNELAKRNSNVFKSFADIQKLSSQDATFQNVHSNIAAVRADLPEVKKDPTLVSLALADPSSELGKQLKGKLDLGKLSKEQVRLIQNIRTLREDLFGLRQFFGNSPVRSNSQVQIMMSQLPDESLLTTGDPEKIDIALQSLERSIKPIEAKFGEFKQIKRTGQPQSQGQGGPNAPTGRPRAVNAQGQAVEWDGNAWVPAQ